MNMTCPTQEGNKDVPNDMKNMPMWLAIIFKILLTIGAVAILVGMTKVVKDFRSRLAKKVTMIILYVAIAGAVLLNTFQALLYPLFCVKNSFADEFHIWVLFLQYVFVQSVFITSFECLYSLKYKL